MSNFSLNHHQMKDESAACFSSTANAIRLLESQPQHGWLTYHVRFSKQHAQQRGFKFTSKIMLALPWGSLKNYRYMEKCQYTTTPPGRITFLMKCRRTGYSAIFSYVTLHIDFLTHQKMVHVKYFYWSYYFC